MCTDRGQLSWPSCKHSLDLASELCFCPGEDCFAVLGLVFSDVENHEKDIVASHDMAMGLATTGQPGWVTVLA